MAKNTARAHCIGLYLVITEEGSALAIAIWGKQENSLMDPHLYLWVCLMLPLVHPMTLYVGEVRLPWGRHTRILQ